MPTCSLEIRPYRARNAVPDFLPGQRARRQRQTPCCSRSTPPARRPPFAARSAGLDAAVFPLHRYQGHFTAPGPLLFPSSIPLFYSPLLFPSSSPLFYSPLLVPSSIPLFYSVRPSGKSPENSRRQPITPLPDLRRPSTTSASRARTPRAPTAPSRRYRSASVSPTASG